MTEEKCGIGEDTHFLGCECHERLWKKKVDGLKTALRNLLIIVTSKRPAWPNEDMRVIREAEEALK